MYYHRKREKAITTTPVINDRVFPIKPWSGPGPCAQSRVGETPGPCKRFPRKHGRVRSHGNMDGSVPTETWTHSSRDIVA